MVRMFSTIALNKTIFIFMKKISHKHFYLSSIGPVVKKKKKGKNKKKQPSARGRVVVHQTISQQGRRSVAGGLVEGYGQSELEFEIGKTAATWSRPKRQKQRRIWAVLVTKPTWLVGGSP